MTHGNNQSRSASQKSSVIQDQENLLRAIEVSEQCRGVGYYAVGCVIVPLGSCPLITGFTGEGEARYSAGKSQSHAEQIAISKANANRISLQGATLYTSLEPCSERKSGMPSCVSLIIESKVARVVYGAREPYNPQLDIVCRGQELLVEAGIEVVQFLELESKCLEAVLSKERK